MKPSAFRRFGAVFLALGLSLTLSACSSKPKGKYVAAGGMETIVLDSGKATVSIMGDAKECEYTVNGDTITLKPIDGAAPTLSLTIMKDGTLQGLGQTFSKSGD